MSQNATTQIQNGHFDPAEADLIQSASPPGNSQSLILTEDELIERLKDFAKQRGFIADAAADLGISAQFLGQILNRKKRPSRNLLDRWGIEIVYRLEVG